MHRPDHAAAKVTRRWLLGLAAYGAFVAGWTRYRAGQLARQSKLTETALGPVEWAEAGHGLPVLVLHGTPGGFDAGLVAAESLGSGFRFISVSRPGYLRTPAPRVLAIGEQLDFEADLCAALLDRIGVATVSVFAYSGGGPYALAFAIRHAERCRSVVLASAETRPDPETAATHFARRVGEELLIASDLVNWIAFGRIARSLTPVSLRRKGLRLDGDIFAGFPNLEMEKIRCPVLLVHGRHDAIVPFDDAQAAALLIPHAELLELDGGHFSTIRPISAASRRMIEFLLRAPLPAASR